MEIQATSSFTPATFQSGISNETKSDISAFLADFDGENLSESDAQAITAQLNESGVKPGKALGDLLNQLGFDPAELAEKAGIETPPPLQKENRELPPGSTFSVTV